ncbi:MAG: hypothetical protein ACPHID_00495 [Thermoplasmatota archaeon]
MRQLAFLLFLGLALAGCATDDAEPAVTPEPEPMPGVFFDAGGQPALAFREPVDLGTRAGVVGGTVPAGAFGTNCQDSLDDGDCGLGEPSIEVDGAGTIYVSGVCCLTVAPPVYASRDGGATFQQMEGDTVREVFAVEGDFAIDEVGRMYFADIEVAATFQMTVWEADGSYVRHTKWPAPPLVDRDWVRAEGDGIVYYVYNTGAMGTRVYKSTDAATTWSADAIHTVPYALGNVAIDPLREICLFGGNLNGMRSLDCSQDGGATWSTEASQIPVGGFDAYPVGAYDENGTLWMAETQVAADGTQAIAVAGRHTDGTWTDLTTILPGDGYHRMPWIAAGADGAAAIAWYGKRGNDTPDGDWHLFAAATQDGGDRWDVVQADPTPVFHGNLGRDLLDFLQVDLGPDGAVHVAYSRNDGSGPDGNEERLIYVRSEPSALAMQDFWLGP